MPGANSSQSLRLAWLCRAGMIIPVSEFSTPNLATHRNLTATNTGVAETFSEIEVL